MYAPSAVTIIHEPAKDNCAYTELDIDQRNGQDSGGGGGVSAREIPPSREADHHHPSDSPLRPQMSASPMHTSKISLL